MKNYQITICRGIQKKDVGTWVESAEAAAVGIVSMSFENEGEAAVVFENLEIEEEGIVATLAYVRGEVIQVIKKKGEVKVEEEIVADCEDCGHRLEYLESKEIHFCRLCDGCLDYDFSGNTESNERVSAEIEYKKKYGVSWDEKNKLLKRIVH